MTTTTIARIQTTPSALTWKGAYRHLVRIAGPVGSYRTLCGIRLARSVSDTGVEHGLRVEVDCPACVASPDRRLYTIEVGR